MKILTLTGKETEVCFLRQHSFSLSRFTEVLADKKPHDKTTEEVNIHLLTITILNTGNYRIVKRELKNFAKKENIGTDKKKIE